MHISKPMPYICPILRNNQMQQELQIHDISLNEQQGIYYVGYTLIDDEGQADVNAMPIRINTLADFVADEEGWPLEVAKCYVRDNYMEVIKSFIAAK